MLWLGIKCENEKGISRLVVKYYSKIPAIVGVFSCKIILHCNGSGPLIWINNKCMSGCNFKLNHSHYHQVIITGTCRLFENGDYKYISTI